MVTTSEDGTAWSAISILNDIKDKAAGIPKIKTGLEDYLTDIKYDELIETECGALALTGTGKGKKSGVFDGAFMQDGQNLFFPAHFPIGTT